MAPQVEHAAAFCGPRQEGAHQQGPIHRVAVTDVPPKIPQSRAFDSVPVESARAVRVRLDRGWHQENSRLRARIVQRRQFDATQPDIASLSHHFQVPARVLSLRWAEHPACHAGGVLKPSLGLDNLSPGLLFRGTRKNNMIEGMRTNFETATQFPNLADIHRPIICSHRYVEGATQIIPCEALCNSQVQGMSVIPTGRDVNFLPHVTSSWTRASVEC